MNKYLITVRDGDYVRNRVVPGVAHGMQANGDLYIYESHPESKRGGRRPKKIIPGGSWVELDIVYDDKKFEEALDRIDDNMKVAWQEVMQDDEPGIVPELLHAELKHADLFDEFQESASALANGTGDGVQQS